jgi:hypothetical protein
MVVSPYDNYAIAFSVQFWPAIFPEKVTMLLNISLVTIDFSTAWLKSAEMHPSLVNGLLIGLSSSTIRPYRGFDTVRLRPVPEN